MFIDIYDIIIYSIFMNKRAPFKPDHAVMYGEAYGAAMFHQDFVASAGPSAEAALEAYKDVGKRLKPLGIKPRGEVKVATPQRNERLSRRFVLGLAAAATAITAGAIGANTYILDRNETSTTTSGEASNETSNSSNDTVNTANAQLNIIATDAGEPYKGIWGVQKQDPNSFEYGYDSYSVMGPEPTPTPSGVYELAGVETAPDQNNPNNLGVRFLDKPIDVTVVVKSGELAIVLFNFSDTPGNTNGVRIPADSAVVIYGQEQSLAQSGS
jgi:hypothetical protein